ncbi:MAG: DUF11 domain-containing protein, partial [Methanobrevibacter sp.]|nr:DUF11 domain-containing protein [Methanobrevibacter sp.]
MLPSVDLSITKEVSDYYIIKGNEVIFTVVVSNAANASNATNLVIEDVLPEGLSGFEIISISKGSFESNKWTISQLDNGTSATLVFKLLSQEFGRFNNTVNVTCDEHDWNLSNNNATVWFEVVPFNLTINKSTDVV